MDLDDVPGGAGGLGDDGRVAPGEGVQQTGFADVGGADDGDVDAITQALTAPVVIKMLCYFFL